MSVWTIPRQWEGATVAVMASGPSMSPMVAELVLSLRIPAIVVNNTFRLAPWADILYAADAKWWQVTPGAMEFAGKKVSCEPVPGVDNLRNAGMTGYSDEADCVHTYSNSGAQAIQIAAKAGARKILLLGFDMHGTHWHGAHEKPLRNTEPSTFQRWIESMATLAAELKRRGVEVVNCTPGSALRCFPMAEGSK
jgi:hypothetical protein